MAFNDMGIDLQRVYSDLHITGGDLLGLGSLDYPETVHVPSTSAIKTGTVDCVLRCVDPGVEFEVTGVKVPSDVAEQPVGQIAIDGALNRLFNGIEVVEGPHPDQAGTTAWFSIENGIFRVAAEGALLVARDRSDEGIVQHTEGADLTTDFDPDAEYEDRAVAAIRIPGHPIIVQVSPETEAVRFPKEAVVAAYEAGGSFGEHTVGSKLSEMGLVANNQNPHLELTADRPEGPLSRQDQMFRAMLRALLVLTQRQSWYR